MASIKMDTGRLVLIHRDSCDHIRLPLGYELVAGMDPGQSWLLARDCLHFCVVLVNDNIDLPVAVARSEGEDGHDKED